MDASDVLAAAEQCERFLLTAVDAHWTAPLPDMEWTVHCPRGRSSPPVCARSDRDPLRRGAGLTTAPAASLPDSRGYHGCSKADPDR